MNLQPADVARPVAALPTTQPRSTAAAGPFHEASLLHGATSTGEVGSRQLSIRVGLWLDETGRVRRARWRTVEDTALRCFAEAACSLLEAGLDPVHLDAEALRSATPGTLGHGDRADLVAAAVQTAFSAAGCRT
jgi:hypothetical protein